MAERKIVENTRLLWEVCGHEQIVGYLKGALAEGRLGHAYIFVGADGLGKKTIVDKFLQSIYCLTESGYVPCGECPACRQIAMRSHPDIYRLQRLVDEKTGKLKREIIIDQIRDLKFKLSQGTLLGGYKAAIIDQAETIGISGANSLLKVLEEPSAKTVIILLANDLSRLPKTVVSRCQVVRFLPVSRKDIENYLIGKKIHEDKAKRIARLSLGRPGRAISLVENPKYLDETQKAFDDFLAIWRQSSGRRLQAQESIMEMEKDEALNIGRLKELLDNWQAALRDLVFLSIGNESAMSNLKAVKELPAGYQADWRRLVRARRLLAEAPQLLGNNISSKNVLEHILLNI